MFFFQLLSFMIFKEMLNHQNQNYQSGDYFNKIYVVFLILHYINILKKIIIILRGLESFNCYI